MELPETTEDRGNGSSVDQSNGRAAKTTELQDLLARVEGATGEDWALSNDIRAVLFPPKEEVIEHEGGRVTLPAGWGSGFEPDLTASLDAALALVERNREALGCYLWRVWLDDEPVHCPYYAELALAAGRPRGDGPSGTHFADGPTAPLALLAAFLRALIAQTPTPKNENRNG